MAKPNPEHLRYTSTHEWILLENEMATCGITDHAQEILSEVVHIELPKTGRKVKAGTPVVVLESAKSVSEVHAPLDGEIVAVNDELKKNPVLINQDPFGNGWIIKIKVALPAAAEKLLTAAAYMAVIGS